MVVTCHTHSPEGRAVEGEDGGGRSGGEGGSSVSALSILASTNNRASGATWDGVHTCTNYRCTVSWAETLSYLLL